ncbi:MAG: ribbon-helix-helix protein, CopG family [Longimonas sp.]
MSNTATQRLTLRLTPEQNARIERLACQKGTSTEDAVRSAADDAH